MDQQHLYHLGTYQSYKIFSPSLDSKQTLGEGGVGGGEGGEAPCICVNKSSRSAPCSCLRTTGLAQPSGFIGRENRLREAETLRACPAGSGPCVQV